jgi:hypothetical protein
MPLVLASSTKSPLSVMHGRLSATLIQVPALVSHHRLPTLATVMQLVATELVGHPITLLPRKSNHTSGPGGSGGVDVSD